MVSRRVSATGTSLLGHPIPARELGPPHGRLTEHAHRHARTLTGLPRSARTSCDRGGCPLCPEDGGAHPELKRVLSRRLPFHHGQSLNPATTSHHARLCFTRHQREFKQFTLSVFPSPVTPGWNRGALGFSPSFAPRRPGAGQRTSGRGQAIEHGPGTTAQLTSVDLQSSSSLVSCDIASHRATHVSHWPHWGALAASDAGAGDVIMVSRPFARARIVGLFLAGACG